MQANWVKIESLPKKKGLYLVYLESDVPETDSKTSTGYFYKDKFVTINNCFSFDMPKITHWAELPDPPFISGKITYLVGDATNPVGTGKKMIVHICNDEGKWGSGFVLSLSKSYPIAENAYRAWSLGSGERVSHRLLTGFTLGGVQIIQVKEDLFIANMIAQRGTKPFPFTEDKIIKPIHYEALFICLEIVNKFAVENNIEIHMPRIGTGLAGGKWEKIEGVIQNTLTQPVFVYDLEK